MIPCILILILMLAPTHAAQAQNRPEPTPRMDVQVTYATTQPDAAPAETQIAFHAGIGVFRIDPPATQGAPPVYILSQRGTDRAVMVMEGRRAWLELEAGAAMPRELEVALSSGRAVRQGTARYVNIACTLWRLPEPSSGTACISQRGVLLRWETAAGLVLEATAVEQRAQEAERFVPPQGYRAITMEDMLAAPR